jgi:hypothetical protein
MQKFLTVAPFDAYDSFVFSCYWYFRNVENQATSREYCGLLTNMKKTTYEMMFTHCERWFNWIYKDLKVAWQCTLGYEVIMHHFSWVRSKDEMLRKVKSWAHSKDRNWEESVKEEFSRPFNGRDFIHGYSYTKVLNRFNIRNN